MGDVIGMGERGGEYGRGGNARPAPASFFFDLACPFLYLAAERVEPAFPRLTWVPASAALLERGMPRSPEERGRARGAAERRAVALRLPLVWPDGWPAEVPGAMRAAARAAELGRGAEFVLAASRLAFCGGYLEESEVLAEASAAAGVDAHECLAAAGQPERDLAIAAAALELKADGADRLPALRVGGLLFSVEARVAEAVAAARGQAVDRDEDEPPEGF